MEKCLEKGCRVKPIMGHFKKQLALRIGLGLSGPHETFSGVLAILCDRRHFAYLAENERAENPPFAHLWTLSPKTHFSRCSTRSNCRTICSATDSCFASPLASAFLSQT